MNAKLDVSSDVLDCVIIGFNDLDVRRYERLVRAMGTDSGAYRDLALALVGHEGRPKRALDLFTDLHFEGRPRPPTPLNNTDFLWPTISYLGSFLERRGYRFDYVDHFHLDAERDKLAAMLRRGNVRSVAITTTLYVMPEPILDIIEFVRAHSEDVTIIVGGPYITNNTQTLDPEALQRFFKLLGADVYVDSSEGEQALVAILKVLGGGGALDFIPNIAFRRGDAYVKTQAQVESSDLVEEFVHYRRFAPDIGQFVSLRTAKSCPFSCAFCGFPARAGKYRYMSVERVEAELDALAELGTVTTLTFLDDTFNVPKKRFAELLRMMIRKRYGFRWNSFYRADHGSPEIIELMAEAGCEGVFLGVESGSDTILANMKKTIRRRHMLEAIPTLREHGIISHASLIVGFPGETAETVAETMDLIEQTRPNFYRAQLWYADPMTPVWDRREEFGIRGEAFSWSHATMDWRTAADHVDRMFLGINNSTWLPQFGFELWSTFYLKRFGLTVPQIETFVATFNAAIKARMLAGRPGDYDAAIEPELLASLRASAQFDRGVAPDPAPVARLSGRAYLDAEAHFAAVFRGCPTTGLGLRDDGADVARESRRWTVACDHDDPSALVLAAFAVMLLRCTGVDDIPLILERPGRSSLPLRVRPRPEQPVRELAEAIAGQRGEAEVHGRFGRHIVGNERRMALHGSSSPRFDACLVLAAGDLDAAAATQTQPFVLALEHAGPGELELRLSIALSTGVGEVIDRLVDELTAALTRVDQGALEAVAPGRRRAPAPAFDEDAGQEFNF